MYIFLILGSCSIAAGIVALIFLPDLPSTARFLTPPERGIAVNRVAANRQGIKNHHFKKYQMWQTFRDPKTWILFIMATGAQIPNAALTSFASLIVKSFGFDTLGTQYMQIPGGAVQFLALITGGFICSRYKNIRFITMIVANTICIIGAGLLVGLPNSNKWGRLVALWLCYFQVCHAKTWIELTRGALGDLWSSDQGLIPPTSQRCTLNPSRQQLSRGSGTWI